MSLWLGILGASGLIAGGDYEPIATVTVGSGGASSIEFTSIPSGFQHLQIRGIARTVENAVTLRSLYIEANSSTSGYAWHALGIYPDNSTTLEVGGAASRTSGLIGYTPSLSSYSTSVFSATVIDILDYASTTKNKTFRSLNGMDGNGRGTVQMSSVLWANTNAITSLKIQEGGLTIQEHSTFALYGVKAP